MNARARVMQTDLPSIVLLRFLAAVIAGCGAARLEPVSEADSSVGGASGAPDSGAFGLPEPKISVSVVLDPGPDDEAYICLTTPIRDAGYAQIQRVAWFPPSSGIALHHASLYAATGSLPDGPLPCDPLPSSPTA